MVSCCYGIMLLWCGVVMVSCWCGVVMVRCCYGIVLRVTMASCCCCYYGVMLLWHCVALSWLPCSSCFGVRECHWCEAEQKCAHVTECCSLDEGRSCCASEPEETRLELYMDTCLVFATECISKASYISLLNLYDGPNVNSGHRIPLDSASKMQPILDATSSSLYNECNHATICSIMGATSIMNW